MLNLTKYLSKYKILIIKKNYIPYYNKVIITTLKCELQPLFCSCTVVKSAYFDFKRIECIGSHSKLEKAHLISWLDYRHGPQVCTKPI